MRSRALHKSKQFFFDGFKYAVPILALLYIGFHLSELLQQHRGSLAQFFYLQNSQLLSILLIMLGFTFLNWSLEGLKWQKALSPLEKISYSEALYQSVVGASAAIFTPARSGEYLAKLSFFEKSKHKPVLILNGLNNFSQMAVTCLFGVVGVYLLMDIWPSFKQVFLAKRMLWLSFAGLLFLSILILVIKKWTPLKRGLLNTVESLGSLRLVVQIFGLSVLRYLVFSTQYIILTKLLGSDLDVYNSAVIVSSIYFLNSVVPSSALSDLLVKGSLGVFLFGLLGLSAWIVIMSTLLMWLANHVIPALAGSYLLLKFRSDKSAGECF